MNEHLPGPLRDALNGSFLRPARIDADPSAIIAGRSSRESSNDGELDAEALAEIDREFAPAFIRTPEHDRRVSSGASFNANAWLEAATGETKYFSTGFDASSGQWDRAYSLERACDQRAASREM